MNVAGPGRSRPVPISDGKKKRGYYADGGAEGRADSSLDVDMYVDVPSFELSLDEFEEYALARLKVLRKIEEMKTRNLPPDAFRTQLDASIKANLVVASPADPTRRRPDAAASRRMDAASHFILRAAYCRTEDLRRWFLAQECHLFRHRLGAVASRSHAAGGNDALKGFLATNDFDLDRVSRAEKERLREKLTSVPGAPGPVEFGGAEYYRVPFVQALELVSRRGCYVEGGHAYVPLANIVSIVVSKFRVLLSKSLTLAAGVFGQVTHDEAARIAPLLKSMNTQYTGPATAGAVVGADGEAVVTAATVDGLAERSMPLCMRQLHDGLKRDHKLKHQGRLQYGLFLKAAGMTLEEHTVFFQREFSKIMTGEQFNKQYAYGIRHMHGKEGKRASYTPYSCTKIIVGNPPPQSAVEHHGCPYRHYDDSNLSALLTKLNIGSAGDRDAIMQQKREGNFQLACMKHFEVMHPGAAGTEGVKLDGVGNHPNAWFQSSVKYHDAKTGGGRAKNAMDLDLVKTEGIV